MRTILRTNVVVSGVRIGSQSYRLYGTTTKVAASLTQLKGSFLIVVYLVGIAHIFTAAFNPYTLEYIPLDMLYTMSCMIPLDLWKALDNAAATPSCLSDIIV